jgi:ribosome-binding protein aMBF1 (putative translation factor)
MPTKPDADTLPASAAVRKFLAAAGRKGGSAQSTLKAKTSAANGKKGGRPSKARANQMTLNKRFSADLRIGRRIARLTQLELATRAGVDDSLISLLESGKRDILTTDYVTVVRIARALNVSADELFPVAANETQAGKKDAK